MLVRLMHNSPTVKKKAQLMPPKITVKVGFVTLGEKKVEDLLFLPISHVYKVRQLNLIRAFN